MAEKEKGDALSIQTVMGMQSAEIPETEEAFVSILSEKIGTMLAENPEYLMSFLYRFDVSETKIRKAMLPFVEDPAHIGLAKLVFERYKQRQETKKKFKSGPIPSDMDDWKW